MPPQAQGCVGAFTKFFLVHPAKQLKIASIKDTGPMGVRSTKGVFYSVRGCRLYFLLLRPKNIVTEDGRRKGVNYVKY